MPDRRYRIATRRLFVACWVAAFGLALVGGIVIRERYTFAGFVLVVMGIGCLRLAREVRDEMARWGSFTEPPRRASSVSWFGDRYEQTPDGLWRKVENR